MVYRGYTPDEINKDKRKNLAGIIAVAFPLLLGLFILVGGIWGLLNIRIEDASEISYEEMESGEDYYFGELILVDVQEVVENLLDGNTIVYYLVRFTDKDGKVVYTTLRPDEYSDLAKICEEFTNDPEREVGDVVLSGCFCGYDNGLTVQKDLKDAYEEYADILPGEILDRTFFADRAETIDEYRQTEASRQMLLFIFAGVIILPCAIGMIMLLRKRKELDIYLKEYDYGI